MPLFRVPRTDFFFRHQQTPRSIQNPTPKNKKTPHKTPQKRLKNTSKTRLKTGRERAITVTGNIVVQYNYNDIDIAQ